MSNNSGQTFGQNNSSYVSPSIKRRMKNLSQNLNDIKSNLAYNTDQYIKTETNFNVDNNNTEVNMLRNEIFNLKTAFKKMVDLMLEEIDEIKHHILGQTSELQKQDDEN